MSFSTRKPNLRMSMVDIAEFSESAAQYIAVGGPDFGKTLRRLYLLI